MPSYSKKQLKFVITLGTGKFGSSEADTVTLEGYRASAYIDIVGGQQLSTMRCKIYGMSASDMNAATVLKWKNESIIANTITVFADGAQVFSGNIVNSWGDYSQMPDVHLSIEAITAYVSNLKPVAARSFPGTVAVSDIAASICKDIGRQLENNGVTQTVTDACLSSTGIEQLRELQRMSGIGLYIEQSTVAITPSQFDGRQTDVVPEVSRETGMIGYPAFDAWGVNLNCLFNPSIECGKQIVVKSTVVQPANGTWTVVSISHQLESEKPGGAWFSRVTCLTQTLAVERFGNNGG